MGDIVDTKAKAPRTDRSACILETRASTTNEMSQRRGVTARDPGWGHPDDVLLYFQRFQSYCEKINFFFREERGSSKIKWAMRWKC